MYVLDTNICIYMMKRTSTELVNQIKKKSPLDLRISSITVAELEFGVANSQFPQKNKLALMKFLMPFSILPFDERDCEAFGAIRTFLKRKGTPIGSYDLQIAAQCLSRNFTLVTNNVGEFKRVPNLKIENWTLV